MPRVRVHRAEDAGELAELAQYRAAGRDAVTRNRVEFSHLISLARTAADQGDHEMAAVRARIAAFFAQWRHPGVFVSDELEGVLVRIGREAGGTPPAPPAAGRPCGRVLHVATNVSIFGGIPRLVRRWMQQDAGRVQSLVLTRQAPDAAPDVLTAAVADTGGRVHDLHGTLMARAAQLRTLAGQADVVVLHTFDHDVVPIIALAPPGSTPTMFVNHSDHGFWLGASVSHVIANLRDSGRDLSRRRRGIAPARNAVLPTIIDVPQRTRSRAEAKRALGLAPDQVLLLSIARAAKYRTIGRTTYGEQHVPLLQQHPAAMLMVVGPGHDHGWQEAIAAANGRIRPVAATEATAVYYEAADIYVDSYPWVSNTSLLEAGSYGMPLVTRQVFTSADCGVLGADMPGLGPMIAVRSAHDYLAALSHLIEDAGARVALGERTRVAVLGAHTGIGWQRALERLYRQTQTCGRRRCLEAGDAPPPVGHEPDVYLPAVLGRDIDVDTIVEDHLGMMPFRRRLACWTELGRSRRLRRSLAQLLPDEWYRRYQRWR